jgi:hypothetical protein
MPDLLEVFTIQKSGSDYCHGAAFTWARAMYLANLQRLAPEQCVIVLDAGGATLYTRIGPDDWRDRRDYEGTCRTHRANVTLAPDIAAWLTDYPEEATDL